jgi:hypothetical protein
MSEQLKALMIRQGYVPPTCTLPVEIAGALIFHEVEAGRSPCWGCHHDRQVCGGQPQRFDGQQRQKEMVGRVGGDGGRQFNVAGLDLGQTNDYSAMCLNSRYDKEQPQELKKEEPAKEGVSLEDLRPADNFAKKPEPGSLTSSLNFYKAGESAFDDGMLPADLLPVKPVVEVLRHYACRYLRRWPLGTSYVEIVDDVRKLDKKLDNLVLVVDNTGVGRPVVDMFRRARLRCRVVPVTITGGKVIVEKPETFEWHVPKVELISSIQVVLQNRRIQFIKGMAEAETLMQELRDYQVRVTAAANEQFNAREGKNDDLVLAVALSVWWGERATRRLKAW